MDIKEKLRLIHASCFYGVGLSPNDRRDMIKEAEEILKKTRRDNMALHYVTQEELEEKLRKMDEIAKIIVDYAGKSIEYEDAVLDVIGEDRYNKITNRIWYLKEKGGER